MSKNNYITDDEIYEIERAIYNDLPSPLFQDVSEVYSDTDKEWLKTILEKDEKYDYIPGWDSYIITNIGRFVNVKHRRQLKPTFTSNTVIAQLGDRRNHYSALYEEFGWEYDFEEILTNYYKEGWPFQIANTYREKFREMLENSEKFRNFIV